MIVGIGVDIVELDRIRGVLARHGERFLKRILTAAEREYCLRHVDPVPHLAARFAAKEAAMKALGTGWSQRVGWTDIEVLKAPSGAPSLKLHRAAAEIAGPGARWQLSLSHDRGAAIAFAIMER